MMKKILFLYSEVMPYTLSVFQSLVNDFDCEVYVVYWDNNKKTPYRAKSSQIRFYKRSGLDSFGIKEIIKDFKPDIIYVSGRMDNVYLDIARYAKKNGYPVVMGSDKQWEGGWKNWLAVLLKNFLYKPYFTHAWISGIYQYEYVKKVGFSRKNIISNLYSADVEKFLDANMDGSNKNYQNTDVLFIGRLDRIKGIDILVKALQELKKDGVFKGCLWMYGNGPMEDKIDFDWIKKMGFASQEELLVGVSNCAFFCLPSRQEPWGVVIHEMAAAGMPMIISDICGAATEFVLDGYNGYTFKANSKDNLKKKITKLLGLNAEIIFEMGVRSKKLSHRITPEISAASLLSLLN